MSKLNSKLFKNKMMEGKKSTEDIPEYLEYKVETSPVEVFQGKQSGGNGNYQMKKKRSILGFLKGNT